MTLIFLNCEIKNLNNDTSEIYTKKKRLLLITHITATVNKNRERKKNVNFIFAQNLFDDG